MTKEQQIVNIITRMNYWLRCKSRQIMPFGGMPKRLIEWTLKTNGKIIFFGKCDEDYTGSILMYEDGECDHRHRDLIDCSAQFILTVVEEWEDIKKFVTKSVDELNKLSYEHFKREYLDIDYMEAGKLDALVESVPEKFCV